MEIATIDINNNTGNQTINIPADFKINDDKVYIKKIGNTLQLIPYHDAWQNMFDSIKEFTPDFMSDRNQSHLQNREPID